MSYKLIKEQFIKEIHCNAKYLQHLKSGAKVILLPTSDENKTFCIGFRTPPKDSTGVPHILEHATLCGSKKFPVKDPFVELLKSSVNNFLNAMTYPDKTVYPFATTNLKDFNNILDIYMDAVFFPNVYKKEEIFKQEGWHYELNNVEDDIIYNGVVYNEMKGAFSDPSQILIRETLHHCFPDTTYGVESGGNPDDIIKLTYQDFLSFRDSYYHPSNCYIIMYGDLDMEKKLEWLDKEYLSKFDKINVDSQIAYQEPFKEVKYCNYEYGINEDENPENKTFYAFGSVIKDYKDKVLCAALNILSTMLFNMPGALLKQALLDAEIGANVSGFCYDGIQQPLFVVTIKNGQKDKVKTFAEVLQTKVQEIIKKGLDKKTIRGIINKTEFDLRANNSNIADGIVYSLNIFNTLLYDDNDPFSALLYDELFKKLKELVETNYFEEVLKMIFIDNKHRVFLTLSPNNQLNKQKEAQLKESLKQFKDSLSKEQLEKLILDTAELKQYQATPSTKEELDTIPLLKREDINREKELVPNNIYKIDGVKVYNQPLNTNKISYLRFAFLTDNMPEDLLSYMGVLNTIVGNVDTKNYSYQELNNEINEYTGGIYTSISDYCKEKDSLSLFSFHVSCLDENIEYAIKLVKEQMLKSEFNDYKHIYELLQSHVVSLKSRIINGGHTSSVIHALSKIHKSYKLSEITTRLEYLNFLEELCVDFENKKDALNKKLQEVCEYLFTKENLIISITGAKPKEKYIKDLIKHLYEFKECKNPFNFIENKENVGLKTSSLVQYVSRVGYFKDKYIYNGALKVFENALSYDYLWTQIRVLGGAYGAMCTFNRNGTVYFTSYRDPKLDKTNEVYNNILTFIDEFNPSEDELTKYVIGAIGLIDQYNKPQAKGDNAFINHLLGYTYEDLMKERKEILDCRVEDVKALRPLIKYVLDQNLICVLGGSDAIDASKILNVKRNLSSK